MKGPTKRQSEIHSFMIDFQSHFLQPVRMRDVMKRFDIKSTSAVSTHFNLMAKKGIVRKILSKYVAV